MNTSDYRRGVEDALTPITYEDVQKATVSSPEAAVNVYNRISDNRRKTLLTKKVTKWANAYHLIYIDVIQTSQGTYPSKQEAEAKNRATYVDNARVYLGAYPIEIEVPL
jgi:hypothetical protein